jgi:alpha-tubulin suppressor-like RCC1 family protein
MKCINLLVIVISVFLAACSEKELSLAIEKLTPTTTTLPPRPELALKQLSMGRSHACALIEDGVKCWGSNGNGQVGNNSTLHVHAAVWVLNTGSAVKSVASAGSHSCALFESGAVKCWGKNTSSQIGDGTTIDRLVPTEVLGLASGVADIAAGYDFNCVLTTGGGVKCWGLNSSGQLGDGSTVTRNSPVDVLGLTTGVKSIRAGYEFACAVLTTGGVKCWGANSYGQLGRANTTASSTPVDVVGMASGVESISLGYYHACARLDSTAAKCWGYNFRGMLGDGTTTNRSSPVDVTGLSSGVKQIESGYLNTCALLDSGVLQCWGYYVGIGDGTFVDQYIPKTVSGVSDPNGRIVSGFELTCFLNSTGTTNYCWGNNNKGVFGEGHSSNPLNAVGVIGLSSGTQSLAAPNWHNCGVVAGAAKCWGANNYGRLGDGTVEHRTSPTQVIGLEANTRSVATGNGYSCAVTTANTVKCWGWNNFGKLGDGTTTDRTTPVEVIGLTDVQTISLGYDHTCVVTTSGGIKCWGSNTYGQLGDASTTGRLNPVDVVGLTSGVQSVTTGAYHTCALTTTGGVKCWGRNNRGQLGDGTTTTRTSPVDVIGFTSGATSVSVSSSSEHSCALNTAGGIKCWGRNSYGILGDGTTVDRSSPVDVQTLTAGVNLLAAGYLHNCALLTGGQVVCWGYNAFGQLGDSNTYLQSLTPVSATGVTSGIQSLLAGVYSSCVVTTAGASLCWGNNTNGQIGNGTQSTITSPARIKIY